MKAKAAMFAVGAVAGWMLLSGAAPAAAAPVPVTESSQGVGVLDHCSVWADYAHGRGRAHANCPGWQVAVRAYCADGSRVWSVPQWRNNYNKAECPAGVGVITFEYYTR